MPTIGILLQMILLKRIDVLLEGTYVFNKTVVRFSSGFPKKVASKNFPVVSQKK